MGRKIKVAAAKLCCTQKEGLCIQFCRSPRKVCHPAGGETDFRFPYPVRKEKMSSVIYPAEDPAVFAVKTIRTAVGFEDRFHADLAIDFERFDCTGKVYSIGTA